ncbi:hypothetical protein KIW84_040275 [Lathyrus oleraceus]|uniref:Uncharacterized protein n=1 Tax=Pisum sativum TaxID=3888 RepID=A0A9D5APU8_PEA|nr:hypothetical protein KIW84_040275 [Pisum sativum]
MFNRDYKLSQDTLGDMLHFPHGDDITYACPSEEEWQYEAFRFLEQLTGPHLTMFFVSRDTVMRPVVARYTETTDQYDGTDPADTRAATRLHRKDRAKLSGPN